MKFSEKLKQAMQQLGINQVQVVGLTGKSKGSISMYLNDKTVPSGQVQSDIAVALGLPADYFEQEESTVTFKPVHCEDGIPTLTVGEVAKLMHKHTNTIALGLQQGVFPWGMQFILLNTVGLTSSMQSVLQKLKELPYKAVILCR